MKTTLRIASVFCVLLMFVITWTEPRRSVAAEEKLTLDWGGGVVRVFDRADIAWTGMVGLFIVGLWFHFR